MGGVIAVVVEAQPIDQSLVARQAKQPRPGIAGLGARRQRADLDEAEAGAEQRAGNLGVLVEARRHAERIGERQTERRDGEARIVAPASARRSQPQRGDRRAVRGLRLQLREKRQRQRAERPHHAPRFPKTWRPSAPSGSARVQRTADSGNDP